VFGQYQQTQSAHRDIVLSPLLRVAIPLDERTRLGVVAGPGFVYEDTLRQTSTTTGSLGSGGFGPLGPSTHITRWTGSLTSGIDVDVAFGAHVRFVPEVRVYWVQREDDSDGNAKVPGLGPLIVRAGLGVRFIF
jgi:hypothetical protein